MIAIGGEASAQELRAGRGEEHHGDEGAADRQIADPEQQLHIAGRERQKQPRRGPNGEGDRRGEGELRTDLRRHRRQAKLEREGAPPRDGLGHEGERDDRKHERKIDEERQPCRPRAIFGEEPAEERTERGAARIGDGDREGRSLPVSVRLELEHRGRARARHHAGRDPLERARNEQRGEALGARKDRGAERAEAEPEEDDGAPADLVRDLPEGEERGDEEQHIDREDQGEDARGEMQLLLIDAIKRRRDRGADEKHEEGVAEKPE